MSECKNCKEILDYCELTIAEALGDKQTMNQNKTILEEAAQITSTDRNIDYGHPAEDHGRVAAFWTTFLGVKLNEPLTPQEVCIMMILLKISRERNKHKRDNLVDICGYARNHEMIEERNLKSSPSSQS